MSRATPRSTKGSGDGGGSGRKGAGRGGRAPKRAAEWLERLLPESDEQSGTNDADRKLRRKVGFKMDEAFDRAIGAFDAIERSLDEDAEDRDQYDREWHIVEREEDRKDIRLGLQVEDAQTSVRERNVLMFLTAVSVVAAIALAFVSVVQREPWFIGGSLISGLLSGGGVYVLRDRIDRRSGEH